MPLLLAFLAAYLDKRTRAAQAPAASAPVRVPAAR